MKTWKTEIKIYVDKSVNKKYKKISRIHQIY
jgi:hypothetical protein